MNIKTSVVAIIGFLFLCIPVVTLAASERITDFAVEITVFENGKTRVGEHIRYDFDSNQRHGILRDIPLVDDNGYAIEVQVEAVLDEQGNSYRYTTQTDQRGLHIKIGDPDVFVSGLHTYTIWYTTTYSMRPFDTHDELYWNVTGNGWAIPIDDVSVGVTLPKRDIPEIQTNCFVGPKGTMEGDRCRVVSDTLNGYVTYTSIAPLQAYEGMTIVLGIPKGVVSVSAPPVVDSSFIENTLSEWWSVIGVGIFFVLYTIISLGNLFKKKKKPSPVIPREIKDDPIITQFTPPKELRPIDVGTILDQKVDPTDISSIIIDLAVRGYIQIAYIHKSIPFWPDKKDFELIKKKEGTDLTHPAEKIVFDTLFTHAPEISFRSLLSSSSAAITQRERVSLSNLQQEKQRMASLMQSMITSTETHLEKEGYMNIHAKNKAVYIEMLSLMAVVLLLVFFGNSWLIGLCAVAVLLWILFIRKRLFHCLTPKGIEALKHILGFKEFLRVTETDRLAFFNSPSKQPEVFETFLPYAMVLGVEKEWSTIFASIHPSGDLSWYHDGQAGTFNSAAFATQVLLFSSSFNQVMQVNTGGSGFSGGSSGGGSGGGGGGSW